MVPQSYSNNTSYERKYVVPCCHECNTVLGNKLYHTVSSRAAYIHGKLQERYKKVLRTPDWEEEELEELSQDMRKSIEAGLAIRDKTRARISFAKMVKGMDVSIEQVWDTINRS